MQIPSRERLCSSVSTRWRVTESYLSCKHAGGQSSTLRLVSVLSSPTPNMKATASSNRKLKQRIQMQVPPLDTTLRDRLSKSQASLRLTTELATASGPPVIIPQALGIMGEQNGSRPVLTEPRPSCMLGKHSTDRDAQLHSEGTNE